MAAQKTIEQDVDAEAPSSAVKALRPGDVERLLVEIDRYLAAVDEFRREGCEITWRARERNVSAAVHARASSHQQEA